MLYVSFFFQKKKNLFLNESTLTFLIVFILEMIYSDTNISLKYFIDIVSDFSSAHNKF